MQHVKTSVATVERRQGILPTPPAASAQHPSSATAARHPRSATAARHPRAWRPPPHQKRTSHRQLGTKSWTQSTSCVLYPQYIYIYIHIIHALCVWGGGPSPVPDFVHRDLSPVLCRAKPRCGKCNDMATRFRGVGFLAVQVAHDLNEHKNT